MLSIDMILVQYFGFSNDQVAVTENVVNRQVLNRYIKTYNQLPDSSPYSNIYFYSNIAEVVGWIDEFLQLPYQINRSSFEFTM